MKFRTLLTAAAVATFGMMSSASASIVTITDFDGDIDFSPFAQPLTLDFYAPENAGTYDTTSRSYSFNGSSTSGGAFIEVFSFFTTGPAILTIGNLNEASDFSTATLTIDDGVNPATVVDLLANPDTSHVINIGSPFSLTTNIVDNVGVSGAGTYDFTLDATPVPVPAGILLMGTALAGFGVMRRRKKAA